MFSDNNFYEISLRISMIIFIIINYVKCSTNFHRGSDICSHWNGRRHFLELGERGELNAFNISVSSTRLSPFSASLADSINRTYDQSKLWYQCSLELVTCSDCVIRVTFTQTNFTKKCDKPFDLLDSVINNGVSSSLSYSSTLSSSANNCPCEQILFSEPPYDTSLSGQIFCGSGKVFRSKTRTLLLKFFYRPINTNVFSLQYFSERNVRILSGSPNQMIVRNHSQITPQIISTPYFPVPYPKDYSIEHILTCETDNCRVRLDFTDFQIGLTSKMEIFDSNGQMLDSYTGEHFRPPVLVSTGKSLLIQFRGNGVTGYGYRIEVTFISEKQLDEPETIPYTDCGGIITGMGGAITMMNMIDNETEVRCYDCIWVIKPASNYMIMKTHISLRVDSLYGMASKSELIIRQGITSDSKELEEVTWPNKGMSAKSHIVPILTGYYIRLKGTFGMSSRLTIVYAIFNYVSCYIGTEFLCQNNHCISLRLRCDGFDHCGDGSDEPDTCDDEWAQRTAYRGWYSHKPNYYFPKSPEYNDLKAASGIFILSSLGVLAVISMWMIVLYRFGMRTRSQRELQNHLQTISELLDRQDDNPGNEEAPPRYEAPPDYEEVIKVGMQNEINASTSSGTTSNTRNPDSSNQNRHHHHHHHRKPHKRRQNRERRDSSASSCSDVGSMIDSVVGSSTNNGNSQLTTMASTSTEQTEDIPNDSLKEVINRVAEAAEACDATATCSNTTKQSQWKDQSVQTGTIQSITSLSIRSQLPSTSYQQNHSNYSIGTTTQFDESSTEFRDQSLDVSLSLAITSNSALNESKSERPRSSIYPAATIPKNLIINHCTERILRHANSTPETWLFDATNKQDIINYGSNLYYERNSNVISKTSTFCSDLPKDEYDGEPKQIFSRSSSKDYATANDVTINHNSIGNIEDRENEHFVSCADDVNKIYDSTSLSASLIKTEANDIHTHQDHMEKSNTDHNETSCFGNVGGILRSSKKQSFKFSSKGRKKYSYRRTRSLYNHNEKCDQQQSIKRAHLKRSSSVDLLVTPVSKSNSIDVDDLPKICQ